MSMQEKLKDNSAINVDIQTIANMIVSLTLTQLTVKLARIVICNVVIFDKDYSSTFGFQGLQGPQFF